MYDKWKTTNPADEELGSTHADDGYHYQMRYRPGDRVCLMVGDEPLYGVVVGYDETGQGTVPVVYDDSSQVWFVDEVFLDLVSRGEEDD